jgi:hypothetical protein
LLYGILQLVVTDEVLKAALGGGTLSKETYIKSVLTRPCSFTADTIGYSCLLEPLDPPKHTTEFKAVLRQDFAGATAGTTVNVVIDLFNTGGGAVRLWPTGNGPQLFMPAQLLLGPCIADADDFDAVMRSHLG